MGRTGESQLDERAGRPVPRHHSSNAAIQLVLERDHPDLQGLEPGRGIVEIDGHGFHQRKSWAR